ncbi:hypothetical protein K490DRAFT_63335 [Saccharata proteae CBS 121410]|uniref:Uncharacterized protein n=1 Tax=Saccharata proteae CBS 121410 TaxID=1314787 RepID=A0A9P4HWG4_9PEZI|nr:hypothetical protein K490DRAFT_63335 [Saccharata proteae CBS 121410]
MPKRTTNRPPNLPPHPHHKHRSQPKNPYDRPTKHSTTSNVMTFNTTNYNQPSTTLSTSSSLENGQSSRHHRSTSISLPTTPSNPFPQHHQSSSLTSPSTSDQSDSQCGRRRSSIPHILAKKAKAIWGMATKIAKASVGEGPAVVHFSSPEKTRRGSTYSEVDALYQNGY